jgi:hypothetical protein
MRKAIRTAGAWRIAPSAGTSGLSRAYATFPFSVISAQDQLGGTLNP